MIFQVMNCLAEKRKVKKQDETERKRKVTGEVIEVCSKQQINIYKAIVKVDVAARNDGLAATQACCS